METLESLSQIQDKIDKISDILMLYTPLVEKLLPIQKEIIVKREKPGFYTLSVSEFPEQHKAGINRVVGFDILWKE